MVDHTISGLALKIWARFVIIKGNLTALKIRIGGVEELLGRIFEDEANRHSAILKEQGGY